MAFVVFAIVCALPAIAFVLFSKGFDWLVSWEPRRNRPPARTDRTLHELGADLRRLAAEHRWLLNADVPGKVSRLRAVELAYDDTLLSAGAALQLDLPPAPLVAATRLQAEAELSTSGFTW